MIYRARDNDCKNILHDDLVLDDIVLSEFDDTADPLQHLINIDCALALSVCKSRNLPSCVFVLSLLYVKRLRALDSLSSASLAKIENLTTKELYLIAALLADKYLVDEGEDEQVFNSELAELTGTDSKRINFIERQVLIALNWNLHVPADEFDQFFTSFKSHMSRKLHRTIDADDSLHFYHLCLKLVPQIVEYLALTSLVLLGSTLSILTAIHVTTLTHSTLMRTFNPIINGSHFPSMCHNGWRSCFSSSCESPDDRTHTNSTMARHSMPFHSDAYPSDDEVKSINIDAVNHSRKIFLDPSACSMDLLRTDPIVRSFVPAFG